VRKLTSEGYPMENVVATDLHEGECLGFNRAGDSRPYSIKSKVFGMRVTVCSDPPRKPTLSPLFRVTYSSSLKDSIKRPRPIVRSSPLYALLYPSRDRFPSYMRGISSIFSTNGVAESWQGASHSSSPLNGAL
jgi:hypothetical protein